MAQEFEIHRGPNATEGDLKTLNTRDRIRLGQKIILLEWSLGLRICYVELVD